MEEQEQGTACLAALVPFLIIMLMWALAAQADFQLGSRVSIPVPPAYDPGFQARAFLLQTPVGILPPVKLALSIFAWEGYYICGLEVTQDTFVMWSAVCPSRFEPVETCVISLSVDGDLSLMDSNNNVGWSSNTSRHGVKYIQLKRSGNLVLRNRFHVMVWQSFDYPCDKLLWAQKLTKKSRLLSPGAAQHTLSLQGNELVLEWRGLRYWAATANADIEYAQMGAQGIELWANGTLNTVVGPKRNNDDAGYADLGLPVHFAALGQAGGLTLYAYGPSWTSVYSAPEQGCDYPDSCGQYGLCTADANGSVNGSLVPSDDVSCSCLPYLVPLPGSRGCGFPAGYELTFCRQPTEFLELWGYDTAAEAPPSGRRKLSRSDCAATCMRDCACVAATSVNDSECQLYSKLGSVRRKGSVVKGLKMWVKVPKGLTSSRESCEIERIHKLILILGASVDSLAVVLIGIGILYYFFVYRPKIRESSQQSQTA